jgi:hypothetical protein
VIVGRRECGRVGDDNAHAESLERGAER